MRLNAYDSPPFPDAADPVTACALPVLAPPSDGNVCLDDLDALFKGFADPTRLRVLNLLAAGELCVCDIVGILGLPQPAVSRHLAYLRRMGLVDATREWKFAHYRLAEPRNAVHGNLMTCVRACFTGIPQLDDERRLAVARVAERSARPC
jgi:ArsR family transcriptional regulator